MAPDAHDAPDWPATQGKPPKSRDELRRSIARLHAVNGERHEMGDHERAEARIQTQLKARAERLVFRLTHGTQLQPLRLPSIVDAPLLAGELWDRVAMQMRCQGCGYDLRGLAPSGTCPECGHRFSHGATTWEQFRGIIATELALPAEAVTMATPLLPRLLQLIREEEARRPPMP